MSDSATPWTIAYQSPLSMGFSRQEYWNGLPFPSPGDLPDPEIKLRSPALEEDTHVQLFAISLLSSKNAKKESKMVVAKRQRREKPTEIEQRKVQGPE